MTDISGQEKFKALPYINNWFDLNFELIFCYAFDIQFSGHHTVCVRFKVDVLDKLNNTCPQLNYRIIKHSYFDVFNIYVSLKEELWSFK